jgi:hypothetical protein
MVEAELALMRAALAAPTRYDRITLLSDDTRPIWPDHALRQWCDSPWCWIELSDSSLSADHLARYQDYYFWDHPLTERRRRIDSPMVDDDFIAAIRHIAALKSIGKKPVKLHHGSQWWSLTPGRVEQVLATFHTDQHFVDSFRYSDIPDESFVHTALAAHGMADIYSRGPCFVDWAQTPRPFVYSSMTELPAAAHLHPFARKFTIQNLP